MNLATNPYYKEMLKKGRMIPFFTKDRMVCFITFYITDNENKYINSDAWEVLEDNSEGKICYVAQVITDKHPDNKRLSYEIWRRFRKYIKAEFPNVKTILGRRWDDKSQAVRAYKKEM